MFQFLEWYLWRVPQRIVSAWKNFLKFNLEFFSIFELLKTLFAPWKQYSLDYGVGFDLQRYAEVFISNLITRILGAFVRSVLIAIGLVVELFIFAAGLAVLAGWIALPLILFYLFKKGLRYLFLAYYD